jgi:hypothetical protein
MGFLGSSEWYAAPIKKPWTRLWISGGNRVEMQLVVVYKVSTHFELRAPMKKAAPKSGFLWSAASAEGNA